jgi:uncharacterized protein (DUF305 family)
VSKSLSVSLILVAFLVGTGFGFVFAPEYAGLKLQGAAMEAPASDSWSDLRFLNTMGRHHRGALDLAVAAGATSQRPEIQEFTKAVAALKTSDLNQFAAWKQAWYHDGRPIEAAVPVHLGVWDQDYDLRFLNALEGKLVEAIAMANAQRRVSVRPEVLTYTAELIRVQTGVLDQVRTWRKAWYGL